MFLWTIKLFISLIIPLGMGYTLLAALFRGLSMGIMLRSALGFGLGFGILSHWMLILGILEIPSNVGVIGCPLIFVLIFFLYKILRRRGNVVFPLKILH